MGKKTILIVDDSPSFRQVLGMTLGGEGYEIIEACDGEDALSQASSATIHLAICDLGMPNMDGFSFIREFKQQHSHRFTPVIVLTTDSRRASKEEGRELGVKAWVVKPFQPEQILDAVAKLMA